MGLRPTSGDENTPFRQPLVPATTIYGTVTPSLSSREPVTFFRHKDGWCRRGVVEGSVPAASTTALSHGNSPTLTTTLSFLSFRAKRGICGAPFGCPTFTVRQPLSLCHPDRSEAERRDLRFRCE